MARVPDRAGLAQRIARGARPWALPLALLAGLELFARTAGRHSDALAPPSQAVQAFVRLLADGSLFQATAFTLGAAGLGLALGSLAGVAAGTVIGLSRRASAATFVSIELLRPVPSVALIPVAMLAFGFGVAMEASIVAFATFWPMLLLAQAAVRQIEPQWLEVAAALELGAWQRLGKVVLPAVLPRLFVALRLGVAVALVVSVTVEIAANPNGLGYALMLSQQSLAPSEMMAWLFWIGLVGYGLNALAERAQQALARRMGAPADALAEGLRA